MFKDLKKKYVWTNNEYQFIFYLLIKYILKKCKKITSLKIKVLPLN